MFFEVNNLFNFFFGDVVCLLIKDGLKIFVLFVYFGYWSVEKFFLVVCFFFILV